MRDRRGVRVEDRSTHTLRSSSNAAAVRLALASWALSTLDLQGVCSKRLFKGRGMTCCRTRLPFAPFGAPLVDRAVLIAFPVFPLRLRQPSTERINGRQDMDCCTQEQELKRCCFWVVWRRRAAPQSRSTVSHARRRHGRRRALIHAARTLRGTAGRGPAVGAAHRYRCC